MNRDFHTRAIESNMSTKRDDLKKFYVYNYASRSNAVYGPYNDRDAADQAICGKKTYSVIEQVPSYAYLRPPQEIF